MRLDGHERWGALAHRRAVRGQSEAMPPSMLASLLSCKSSVAAFFSRGHDDIKRWEVIFIFLLLVHFGLSILQLLTIANNQAAAIELLDHTGRIIRINRQQMSGEIASNSRDTVTGNFSGRNGMSAKVVVGTV